LFPFYFVRSYIGQILTKSNLVVLYECVPTGTQASEHSRSTLNVKLVKTFSQVLDIPAASSAHIPRNLVPFSTRLANVTFNGIFCTGVKPFWLILRRDTPVRLYRSSHAVVFSFTSTSAFRSRGDFIAHTEEVRIFQLLQKSFSQQIYDVGSLDRTLDTRCSAWSGASLQNRPHRKTIRSYRHRS
jgi:hypothetical protein